jgi:hypothetical protein
VLPKIVLAASLAAVLFGTVNCAEADESGFAKDCQTHFASEGSFLVGRKYSTWIEFPAVLKDDAYSRVYASIAKDGWNIVNADKPAGVISAAQNVSYGKGSQAPMVLVIETAGTGSKVSATFRIAGGQTAKEETIRTKLCVYLGAASAP